MKIVATKRKVNYDVKIFTFLRGLHGLDKSVFRGINHLISSNS